jgi:hypothetical protein
MSHDRGNPFSKETGEYLQEVTEAPVMESDLNSTPEHKADELADKAKELEGKVATNLVLNVLERKETNDLVEVVAPTPVVEEAKSVKRGKR